MCSTPMWQYRHVLKRNRHHHVRSTKFNLIVWLIILRRRSGSCGFGLLTIMNYKWLVTASSSAKHISAYRVTRGAAGTTIRPDFRHCLAQPIDSVAGRSVATLTSMASNHLLWKPLANLLAHRSFWKLVQTQNRVVGAALLKKWRNANLHCRTSVRA